MVQSFRLLVPLRDCSDTFDRTFNANLCGSLGRSEVFCDFLLLHTLHVFSEVLFIADEIQTGLGRTGK